MSALLLSFLLLLNVQSSTSDSAKVSSEIEQVTVFKNQAQIQRKAEVDLNSGTTIVVFTGLSETLIDQSIQLRGNGAFTLLSLTTRNDYSEKTTFRPDIQTLRDKRIEVQQQIAITNANLEVIKSEIVLVHTTQDIIKRNKLTPSELENLLSLYRSQLTGLLTKRISENNDLNKLTSELEELNKQIRESGVTERNSYKEVIAEVLTSSSQKIEFELDYQVYSAGWEATYDLRSEDIDSPLGITYKAKIFQNTGIDWNDVKFIINSGDPTSNSTKPELSPNYVGYFVSPIRLDRERDLDDITTSQLSAKVSGYRIRGSESIEVHSESVVAQAPQIISNTEVSNQTSFSYEIAIPYSVPSDGKFHTVEIKRESPKTDYEFSAAPKLSPNAYLIGSLPDWSELNLIQGEANIYFDNRFVGTTFIDPSSIDDTLSVSLGKDERIVIDHEKLRDFSSKNFFRNKVKEAYTYEISIRNSKSEAITITIEDQIPISTNEEIKVSAKDLSNGKLDKETGIITWEVTLDPGETQKVRFGFDVEYPKGKRVVF